MRRLAIAIAAILFFAAPALAQRTVVSGTVTDFNGLAYVGGTLVATLSLPVGASGATLNGVQIGGATQRVTLDNTGSFLMQLPDNNVVQPPGTQWTFNVTFSPGIAPPLGTGPQTCSATVTITGASQSISTNLGGCPALASSAGAGPPTILDPVTPSVAGQAQIIQATTGGSGAGSSAAQTFVNPVSQGHTILAYVHGGTAFSITGVTDTQGDSFAQGPSPCNAPKLTGGAATFNTAVFIATNAIGGASTTVTATFGGSVSNPGLTVIELTPSTIDVCNANNGSSTSLTSGNVTTTTPQETLLGLAFPTNASSIVLGSGYSSVQGGLQLGTFFNVAEFQVVNSTGTYSASITAGAGDWAMHIVAMLGTPVTPISFNGNVRGPVNLGTITGPLTPVQFQISNAQSSYPSGQLNIAVTSGSITNGAFALEASLDGGTTWQLVPVNTAALTNLVGSDRTPIFTAQYSIVGLAGAILRFGPSQGFAISNLVVWVSIG